MASKKSRTATYQLLPEKQWFTRASLVLLALLGLSLLTMSKTGNPWVSKLRTGITDMVTPVLSVAARPMDALQDAGIWVSQVARLREENVALRNQNLQLLQWQRAAKSMEAENKSLQALLNVVPSQRSTFVTARIVSDSGGPYVHSALVNGGSANGIKKDQAVLNENGLIGRVVDAGKGSARVLLLGDINSHVPVVAEGTNEKMILSGNNSALPTLSYVATDSKIKVGDRIVTSGDGGIFPPGVPVGIVTSLEKGAIKVQPFVNPAAITYVSIVDYSL